MNNQPSLYEPIASTKLKKLWILGNPTPEARQAIFTIASRGWRIQYLENTDEDTDTVARTGLGVGLAFLPCGQCCEALATKTCLANGQIQWIALVDNNAIEGPLGRSIAQLFFAYHMLPINIQRLECLLDHAYAMVQLRNIVQHRAISKSKNGKYRIIGNSAPIKQVFKKIDKVSRVNVPVFINGETGTGKELTARAIHDQSTRRNGPFVVVNCGAIPESLIQSELFGYAKGAFTGAHRDHKGYIEAASGGTLFLDEIADLPLALQTNLLRFLEDKTIQRVGSTDHIDVDVRILSATHDDLEKAVAEGLFRQDLYHRLNVIQIDLPPLRDRPEDIELLSNYFFERFLDRKVMRVRGFCQEAQLRMRQHHWPGNVRELLNRIHCAMVMCDTSLIRPIDLGIERRIHKRHYMTLEQARNDTEREIVISALLRNKYNVKHTSKELDVSRVTLYRLLEKHGLKRDEKHK